MEPLGSGSAHPDCAAHEDSITAGLDANWIAIVSSILLEAPEAGHDSRYGIEIPYVSRCPRVK